MGGFRAKHGRRKGIIPLGAARVLSWPMDTPRQKRGGWFGRKVIPLLRNAHKFAATQRWKRQRRNEGA